jgi:hypothetical protein
MKMRLPYFIFKRNVSGVGSFTFMDVYKIREFDEHGCEQGFVN